MNTNDLRKKLIRNIQNTDNIKIGVYYIATDFYKKLFPAFLATLPDFYPQYPKSLNVISDGLDEYKNYDNDNIHINICPKINHYPWPIITLYKMYHILQNFDDTCSHICYFNANSLLYPCKDKLDFTKMNCTFHSFGSKNHKYTPVPSCINPRSAAYLEDYTYDYIQGGFFFAPSEIARKMCEDVCEMLRIDMSKRLFPTWHDESYLNKWCIDNSSIVVKKQYGTVYDTSEFTEDTFIRFASAKELTDVKNDFKTP